MEYLCGAFFVALAVGAVVLYVWSGMSDGKARIAAADAYRESLEELQNDPNNPELRRRTLQLGRAYCDLARKRRGVTTFDEAMLKNDIDAACAGSVSIGSRSLEDRLGALKRLHTSGHIDDREYRERRKSILDEV